MPEGSFLSELRRRNVSRVAVAYLVLSWLLVQAADVLFPALNLPDWSVTFVVALLTIGFLPALIFAWVYELTPDGLKLESEIEPAQSITAQTGRRLNFITIALVVVGIGVVLVDNLLFDQPEEEISTDSVNASIAIVPPTTLADDTSPFLAVLPFKATGSDEGGFLANGLHDDLLTRLARLGAFKVISRTSMMEYKDTTKNMRQIGEELGAGYILEGSVQSLNGRIRVNAQLIDSIADKHLWADSYDRALTSENLFDIQAELATVIAVELKANVSETTQTSFAQAPTQNTEAYKAYLRGLQLINSGDLSIDALSRTVAAFEEAVHLDGEFATAWAALSKARLHLARPSLLDEADQEVLEGALTALAEARSISPDLLEAELAWVEYLALGLREYAQALAAIEALGSRVEVDADALELKSRLYGWSDRYDDAYQTLLKGQKLNPRSAAIAARLIYYSIFNDNCAAASGHVKEALALSPRHPDVVAAAVDYEVACRGDLPRAVDMYRGYDFADDFDLHNARLVALTARDYERLLELAEIPLPEDRPLNPIFDDIDKFIALKYLNRNSEAINLLDKLGTALSAFDDETLADNQFWYARARAWYHAFRGDKGETQYWLEKERQYWDAVTGDAAFPDQYIWQARILATAGLEDEAIAALRKPLEEGSRLPFIVVFSTPELDTLKDNPAFRELRGQYELKFRKM
jgi:TolB-like protein